MAATDPEFLELMASSGADWATTVDKGISKNYFNLHWIPRFRVKQVPEVVMILSVGKNSVCVCVRSCKTLWGGWPLWHTGKRWFRPHR